MPGARAEPVGDVARLGPGAVGVRVVGLEEDVLEADRVAAVAARAGRRTRSPTPGPCTISLGARSSVHAAGRRLRADDVHPLEQVRHPADLALGERDLQRREARRACPRTPSRTASPAAFCELSAIVVASGASGLVAGIVDDEPMCIDTVVSRLLARVPEHVPLAAVERREAELRRVLRERDRVAALRRAAPDLVGRERGSHSGTSVSGIRRPWPSPPHHSSIIQSL